MGNWTGRPHLSLLGGKEEDRFTLYLCELLRDKGVLRRFVTKICGIEVAPDTTLSALIQATVPGGRADLAIHGESVYLLFEAKLGSWLHEDQLTPYARALDEWSREHPTGTARLFVLTPQQQVSRVPNEAIGITWEEIATLFQEFRSETNDSRLAVHLQDFAEVVFHRLGDPSRPFTLEESQLLGNPLTARAIRRAKDVARKAGEQLLTLLQGSECNPSYGAEYDGYWLKYGGRGWWYGIWIVAWAKIGLSPTFFQLSGLANRPLPPLPNGLPNPVELSLGNRTDWVIPLAIRDGVEFDTLASEHAEIIRRYATELPHSGEALQSRGR